MSDSPGRRTTERRGGKQQKEEGKETRGSMLVEEEAEGRL
jgi:hypothetical protein